MIQKYNAPSGSWRVGLALLVAIVLILIAIIRAPYIRQAKAQEVVATSTEMVLEEVIVNRIIDETDNKKMRLFVAYQTKYSRKDSCHYPKTINGRVHCLTAIGRDTKEGTTVACPRNLKLGTRLWIEGLGERVCEDRYNENLDKKRGLPTVDVFAEAENMKDLPSKKKVNVYILN